MKGKIKKQHSLEKPCSLPFKLSFLVEISIKSIDWNGSQVVCGFLAAT